MDRYGREINTFDDWMKSGLDNGYCFKADWRFLPGELNSFYYSPVKKPVQGEIYVDVNVFDRKGDNFRRIEDKVFSLLIGFCTNNPAFPLPKKED